MNYLENIKSKINNKKVCIYPMGIAGKSLLSKLQVYGIDIDFFCDKNPELWGNEFQGKICVSKPQLLEMNQDELIVIIESLYYKEIKEELCEEGIKNIVRIYPEKIMTDQYLMDNGSSFEKKVEDVLNICEDEKSKKIFKYLTDSWKQEDLSDDYFECIYDKNQYFDTNIVNLSEDEVFVDVGAYIGDTLENFLVHSKNNFEKVYLFELDKKIYSRLQDNIKNMGEIGKKIDAYPYGLSDENKRVCFVEGDSSSSITDEKGDAFGDVRRMDDLLKNERVTFIKMDIEGAETAALRGAEEIIKSQKPKLAICIYHSPEDMLNIPVYLKKLVPDYHIYIRHYTDMMLETVCYAIP